jgi:hypothetical protein
MHRSSLGLFRAAVVGHGRVVMSSMLGGATIEALGIAATT